LTTTPGPTLGPTQPPIHWVTGALSLGVKWLGREADHLPLSIAKVKECAELYLHSPIRLHGVVLSLKETQGQLYLYILGIVYFGIDWMHLAQDVL